LVEAAGAVARMALDNARLQTALRAQLREPPPALAELTARELEVLALIAEGRTDRGIARELFVTPKTVEAHVRSIFRKLALPADAPAPPSGRRAAAAGTQRRSGRTSRPTPARAPRHRRRDRRPRARGCRRRFRPPSARAAASSGRGCRGRTRRSRSCPPSRGRR